MDLGPASVQHIENPYLDCIGTIREAGRFHDILIMQNNSKEISFDEGEFAYQQISDKLRFREGDNASVAEALNDLTNWNAHLLTYERENKNQKYHVSKDQLSGLDKFAYIPVLGFEEHFTGEEMREGTQI